MRNLGWQLFREHDLYDREELELFEYVESRYCRVQTLCRMPCVSREKDNAGQHTAQMWAKNVIWVCNSRNE